MELALVINAGSSSYKCALFSRKEVTPLWKSHLHWEEQFQKMTLKVDSSPQENVTLHSNEEALDIALKSLPYRQHIFVVGHRVVHGGNSFLSTTLINPNVIDTLTALSELAPLHIPSNIAGIRIAQKLFPSIPHYAVFDTTFHASLPETIATYPCPFEWKKWGIRRYGFHGINFHYCTKTCENFLKKPLTGLKIIICHLGSGASLCAVQDGKSIDTTMGFTPLEGLMMATRSGTIDPGILLYLLRTQKVSLEKLENDLNFQSGLLGISGISGDMREILQNKEKGDPRSTLAFEMFVNRLTCSIGALVASLQGMDVLVFTGGIGEHAPEVRSSVCSSFGYLGICLDEKKNEKVTEKPREISDPSSKIRILIIPAQEEKEIATECWHALASGFNCQSG